MAMCESAALCFSCSLHCVRDEQHMGGSGAETNRRVEGQLVWLNRQVGAHEAPKNPLMADVKRGGGPLATTPNLSAPKTNPLQHFGTYCPCMQVSWRNCSCRKTKSAPAVECPRSAAPPIAMHIFPLLSHRVAMPGGGGRPAPH